MSMIIIPGSIIELEGLVRAASVAVEVERHRNVQRPFAMQAAQQTLDAAKANLEAALAGNKVQS